MASVAPSPDVANASFVIAPPARAQIYEDLNVARWFSSSTMELGPRQPLASLGPPSSARPEGRSASDGTESVGGPEHRQAARRRAFSVSLFASLSMFFARQSTFRKIRPLIRKPADARGSYRQVG